MPAGQGGSAAAADSGRIISGSHVFESEIRTEPQIRQYIPPHSHPGGEHLDNRDNNNASTSYQQGGPDSNFTWVRSPLGD